MKKNVEQETDKYIFIHLLRRLAFWMCSLDVRLSVKCVFNVIFSVKNLKITSKTHASVKRTSTALPKRKCNRPLTLVASASAGSLLLLLADRADRVMPDKGN
jgi:hypothetical protein